MRSDPLTKGINAAPQRSLLKALGLCDAEIGKPLIGIVSSKNDIVPGHMNLLSRANSFATARKPWPRPTPLTAW